MLSIYTDGSVSPKNPGFGGYGVVIEHDDVVIDRMNGFLGNNISSNQCEYVALIAGLDTIDTHAELGEREITIFSDSALVVNQVKGEWAVQSARTRPLWREARNVANALQDTGFTITFEHVNGHAGVYGNEEADGMAKLAVEKRNPATNRYLKLLSNSEQSILAPRGYEILRDYVKNFLLEAGWVTSIHQGITDKEMREMLHRVNSFESNLLLRNPSLLTITPSGVPSFVSAQTSYKVNEESEGLNGAPTGKRVITYDIWDALQSYINGGHNVFLVHQPYSGSRWLTYEDMRWDGDGVIPPYIADVRNLTVEEVETPPGWRPTGVLLGEWTPLDEWVRLESEFIKHPRVYKSFNNSVEWLKR